MQWLWLLVRDPGLALDWRDCVTGRYDHGKVVPDVVLTALVIAQIAVSLHTWTFIPVPWGAIDLSAAFGAMAWRAFLRSKSPADDAPTCPDKTPEPDMTDHPERA